MPAVHGSAALAPFLQKEPATHVLHDVLPGSSWKVPVTHLLHDPLPTSNATVPGLHGVGSTELVLQKDPIGHAVH